jgi:retinol dehydrogenase 12
MKMQKMFVVTGATSGIGLEAADQLADTGAFVIGVGRSAERCGEAEKRLRSAHPEAEVHYLTANLSLQVQVRELAKRVGEVLSTRKIAALDGLVNDAGTFTYYQTLTPEGFEMQWAVNHLAPFLLTHELLPLLAAAPAARVVTVSSGSHYNTQLRWNDLQLRRGYNGLLAYKQTKLCNVYFTAELRRRLGQGNSIQAFAADPGLVHTAIGQKGTPGLVRWFWGWWSQRGITAEESARGVVFLATEPSIQNASEIYWKHSRPMAPNPRALDPQEAYRLWEISAQMCGIEKEDQEGAG